MTSTVTFWPRRLTKSSSAACPGCRAMILFGNINIGLEECRATPGAILVDVREVDEFASGHIPNAVNEPLSTIKQTTLPKDKPLFLYCLRGTRSKRAARILRSMGYTVKSIGGIGRYKGELER